MKKIIISFLLLITLLLIIMLIISIVNYCDNNVLMNKLEAMNHAWKYNEMADFYIWKHKFDILYNKSWDLYTKLSIYTFSLVFSCAITSMCIQLTKSK
jgi:hypothetical protein